MLRRSDEQLSLREFQVSLLQLKYGWYLPIWPLECRIFLLLGSTAWPPIPTSHAIFEPPMRLQCVNTSMQARWSKTQFDVVACLVYCMPAASGHTRCHELCQRSRHAMQLTQITIYANQEAHLGQSKPSSEPWRWILAEPATSDEQIYRRVDCSFQTMLTLCAKKKSDHSNASANMLHSAYWRSICHCYDCKQTQYNTKLPAERQCTDCPYRCM